MLKELIGFPHTDFECIDLLLRRTIYETISFQFRTNAHYCMSDLFHAMFEYKLLRVSRRKKEFMLSFAKDLC